MRPHGPDEPISGEVVVRPRGFEPLPIPEEGTALPLSYERAALPLTCTGSHPCCRPLFGAVLVSPFGAVVPFPCRSRWVMGESAGARVAG